MRAGLATIEAGAGGRPLLLVHGFTSGKDDFAPHLGPFADLGCHAVAVDLPGHGASQPVGFTHGFDAYAGALLAVAVDLGWDRFALVGHSMGGIVAQHLALAAPDRLTALVLVDTSPDRIAVDPGLVELACEVVVAEGIPALLAAQKALGNPFDTDAARRLREERPGWEAQQDVKLLRSAPDMYVAMARATTTAPSRVAALAVLRVPTLVVVGEQDAMLLDASRELAAAIPGARLAVIPGAGHNPHVEAPEAWFATVASFLGGAHDGRGLGASG